LRRSSRRRYHQSLSERGRTFQRDDNPDRASDAGAEGCGSHHTDLNEGNGRAIARSRRRRRGCGSCSDGSRLLGEAWPKATLQLADELLGIAREIDPSLELKYNKFYVGLSKGGHPFNFVVFRPRKSTINIEIKLDETEEIDAKIEQAGIEALDYDARWGRYRLSLHKDDLTKHRPLLKELLQAAYQSRSA
jgi:hypothetical protein